MLPDEIKQSDMLDILFENRNKNYGAYILRKFYNQRLILAITGTFLIASIFTALQLLHRAKEHHSAITVFIPDDPHLSIIELPKPEPKLQTPPVHFRQTDWQTPVIASTDEAKPQPTIADLINSTVSNVTADGEIPPDNTVVAPANNNGNGNVQSAATTPEPIVAEGPVHIAEVMPEFPGGIDALRKFLLKNIRQPDDLQAGEKIVVLVSFVVSKNGSIEDAKIISSGRSDLDKEVLRVVGKMPLWRPGMQNNHEVAVYFNLPVTFLGADEE